ncbi:adenosylcobalamin/alpha-ribazole phosphatase [Trabulsiella odontotermitis]|uniref:adenosylcobalamin/alpha-ribazole phosphatase n=1 Tax=Trabulsiella odontotermitis TaxID=379893 RepID=UPI003ACFAAF4
MKLWLVRHGETEANVAGVYSGHAPTSLTSRGIQQAETLATLLWHVPFDIALCSELERAQHTARLVLAGRDVPMLTTPLLNEMFFGDWEMRHHRDLTIEDSENYAAWCADWQHATPTNGEGFQAFSRRVQECLALLREHYHHQHVLVVSHQGVLSLMTALLLGLPAAAMWHFPIDQGAWSLFDLRDDFISLQVLNSRAIYEKASG